MSDSSSETGRRWSLSGQTLIWYLASLVAHVLYGLTRGGHVRAGSAGLIVLLVLAVVDALFVVPAFLFTALFLNRRADLPRPAVPVVVILMALAFEAVFNAAFPSVMPALTEFALRTAR